MSFNDFIYEVILFYPDGQTLYGQLGKWVAELVFPWREVVLMSD